MLGWDGGDLNVPCTCTHVGCYARCWVGVGGMLTFLALAHMLDATQDVGLGWGGCKRSLHLHTCWKKKTPLIRYSNSSAPLTRTPPSFMTCWYWKWESTPASSLLWGQPQLITWKSFQHFPRTHSFIMKKSHVPSFSHFNMRNLSQPFAKRIAWSQNLSILPQETPRFRTVGIRIKQLCRRQASKLLPQKWPSENQETSKRGFTASREILFLEWVLPNFLKQIRFILSKRLWKFRNSRSEFCVSVGKKKWSLFQLDLRYTTISWYFCRVSKDGGKIVPNFASSFGTDKKS